jgi:hypothetical protein
MLGKKVYKGRRWSPALVNSPKNQAGLWTITKKKANQR